MKGAFKSHILPILFCIIAGASLAMLASDLPIPEPGDDSLDYVLPVRKDDKKLLQTDYEFLQQQFPLPKNEENPEPPAPDSVSPPKKPLLFFGLVHQGGQARVLMGEDRSTYPLRSYRAGENLPDGKLLREINQDTILLEKTDGTFMRMDLYPSRPSDWAPEPNF